MFQYHIEPLVIKDDVNVIVPGREIAVSDEAEDGSIDDADRDSGGTSEGEELRKKEGQEEALPRG